MTVVKMNTKKIALFFSLVLLAMLSACASQQIGKYSSQEELLEVYLKDYKSSVLEIAFERGHTSHRILAYHKMPFCQLQIFRDKLAYKKLKIDENKFRDLLSRTLETAGTLYRRPANKEDGVCRTPFIIAVKKREEAFSVQGCRAAEESSVFTKLIADIEHLATVNSF